MEGRVFILACANYNKPKGDVLKEKDTEIGKKLDDISRLLIILIRGEASDSEMVKKLSKARFKPAEIGRMLGIKTSGVTSRISRAKKKTKKKVKK